MRNRLESVGHMRSDFGPSLEFLGQVRPDERNALAERPLHSETKPNQHTCTNGNTIAWPLLILIIMVMVIMALLLHVPSLRMCVFL